MADFHDRHLAVLGGHRYDGAHFDDSFLSFCALPMIDNQKSPDIHAASTWYDDEVRALPTSGVRNRDDSSQRTEKPLWSSSSWRSRPAAQQPVYADAQAVQRVEAQLRRMPPLVTAGETARLRASLARVSQGEAFIFQAGDCAESFSDLSAGYVRDNLCVLLQASVVLCHAAGLPVVKIARMAGQYAKPRSSPTEEVNGRTLPVYRGDIINELSPTAQAREPDPQRMISGYTYASSTMNLIRGYISGGLADLRRVHRWNLAFIRHSPIGERFAELAAEIDRTLRFMSACGVLRDSDSAVREAAVYSSHEALLLPFEEAMTRQDTFSGDWIDTSAHFLWIGDRTRQVDHAHVHFLSGVVNPIGIKCGPSLQPDELIRLLDDLNPHNDSGRILLITRFGADQIRTLLPPLVRCITEEGRSVSWLCDPMHGNTVKSDTGYKTRMMNRIEDEIRGFFEVHWQLGTHPGGIHLEMTGQNVTECSGGGLRITDQDLSQRYHTACDPRLNAHQTLEIAFLVADLLREHTSRYPSGSMTQL